MSDTAFAIHVFAPPDDDQPADALVGCTLAHLAEAYARWLDDHPDLDDFVVDSFAVEAGGTRDLTRTEAAALDALYDQHR